MRDYNIKKYKGNTHYSVSVTDSYGRETGSFFRKIYECYEFIYDVWDNEVPKTKQELQEELLGNAIANCIKIDKAYGLTTKLD